MPHPDEYLDPEEPVRLPKEDERILAWERIAKHPFFRPCYEAEDSLIAAMMRRLDTADIGADIVQANEDLGAALVEARAKVALIADLNEEAHRDGWSALGLYSGIKALLEYKGEE